MFLHGRIVAEQRAEFGDSFGCRYTTDRIDAAHAAVVLGLGVFEVL